MHWDHAGVHSTEYGGVLSSEISNITIRGSRTVRSRGSVRAREGPLSKVSLYTHCTVRIVFIYSGLCNAM